MKEVFDSFDSLSFMQEAKTNETAQFNENERRSKKQKLINDKPKETEKNSVSKEPVLNYILLYKPIGKTPLEVIEQYKQKFPGESAEKMSYAGRLDPMAHGLLIGLKGDSVMFQKHAELMEKEYEFEILFGVTTDTFDILGEPQSNKLTSFDIEDVAMQFKQNLHTFTGQISQQYPPYSSVRIKGKPLWYWARNNKLHEISVPEIKVEIKSLRFISERRLSASEIQKIINERIGMLNGKSDFRQSQILAKWSQLLSNHNNITQLPLLRISSVVSAGCYIRSLCDRIGKEMNGVGAIAFEIKRIRVGHFLLSQAIHLEQNEESRLKITTSPDMQSSIITSSDIKSSITTSSDIQSSITTSLDIKSSTLDVNSSITTSLGVQSSNANSWNTQRSSKTELNSTNES